MYLTIQFLRICLKKIRQIDKNKYKYLPSNVDCNSSKTITRSILYSFMHSFNKYLFLYIGIFGKSKSLLSRCSCSVVATIIHNILSGKEVRSYFNKVVWKDLSNEVTLKHRICGRPRDVLPQIPFQRSTCCPPRQRLFYSVLFLALSMPLYPWYIKNSK